MTFYSVVVIYNENIKNSLTCKNIMKIKNHSISVIIVDNSTKNMKNEEVCNEYGWKYISMNGNAGLSKAYNRVLDELTENDGILIWFDDDTNITQEYFDELANVEIDSPQIDIFAPVIYGQDQKIWSPNEARFFKNKQLNKPNDILDYRKFNAINSCTAVRMRVYKEYRYNEELFLDQVDHDFFEDQRNLGRKFYKMNTIIKHNFSLKSKMKSIDHVKARYKIMIPDFLVFCSKKKSRLFLGMIKVMAWGIREGIRYKSIDIFLWCNKEAIKTIKEKGVL